MVGCGVIFKYHVAAIAALPAPRRIRVAVVVEPDPAARAAALLHVQAALSGAGHAGDGTGRAPAVAAFASLGEALAADPLGELFDAVDIMVPSLGTLHERVATQALRAGRHVLLEKPIAVTIASGERILAAHEEAREAAGGSGGGPVLMVAENSQYWHEVVAARRAVEAGRIGRVVAARAKFWESAHPSLNEWAAAGCYAEGAAQCVGPEGFVFDGGLHFLRPLRMLLGEAVRVCAVAGHAVPAMRGPSITNALITFTSGVTAVFEAILAPGAISEQPFFVVQGSEGEIVIDGFAGGARMYTVAEGRLRETDLNEGVPPGDPRVGWDTGYAGEMADFAAAILDGTAPAASARDALADLRLMLAVMQAAESGSWVSVADVAPDTDMEALLPRLYGAGAAAPQPGGSV